MPGSQAQGQTVGKKGLGEPKAWVLEQQQVRIPGSVSTLLFLFSITQETEEGGRRREAMGGVPMSDGYIWGQADT